MTGVWHNLVLKSKHKVKTKGDLVMKTKVICKEFDKGTLSFYAIVDGKEYFLFQQGYKKTVYDYFMKGVNVNATNDYSNAHSHTVRKTLDKLPSYIRYVEKEYDIEIYQKTKELKKLKNNKPYKRQTFRWQDYAWAI